MFNFPAITSKAFYLSVLVSLFLLPLFVSANTIVRTGDSISVANDQVVEGDFYAVGSNVSMSGEVTEDFFSITGKLTSNGSVGEDMLVIAGSAQIHATVTDDVRILAGDATIASHVSGDVIVIAGTLHILSSASIEGDVLFYGEYATVEGSVGGSVMGTSNTLRIDAVVGKDVDVKSGTLTLGEKAVVNGDVRLQSSNELVRAQNATIIGDVAMSDVVDSNTKDSKQIARNLLVPLLISLFAALSAYLLFRRHIEILVFGAQEQLGVAMVVGLGGMLFGPVVILLLFVTVLGIFVGLVGLFVYLLGLIVAFVLSQIILGSILVKLATKRNEVTPYSIAIGAVAFHVCALIPVIGGLFMIAMVSLAFGSFFRLLYKHTR